MSISSASMKCTLACDVQPGSSVRNFQPAVEPNRPELRLLDTPYRLNKLVLADTRVNVASTTENLELVDFLVLRTVKLGVDTPGDLVSDLGLDDSRRSRIRLTDAETKTTDQIDAGIQPGLALRLRLLTPDQVQALLESLETLCGDSAS